jgi:hypothetical protein
MDRTDIEIKLNRDRAWLLETVSALAPGDVTRPATRSAHDPSSMWSAQDHLAHLAGIEQSFVQMIRRFLGGESNPVAVVNNADGTRRPMDEIMRAVNEMNERWVVAQRGLPLAEIIALGQRARAETLALLGELSDEQLAQPLPGAPWSDGTIGGVLSVNAEHGRMHWKAVKEGVAARRPGALDRRL